MATLVGRVLVLAVSFLSGAANASAQPCETRPLPFDVFQGGELEPVDCRVRGDVCSDCLSPVPGEYWTLEAGAGDLILISYRGTTGQYAQSIGPSVRVFEPSGRETGGWWPPPCEADFGGQCAGHSFRAEAAGTFRVLVYESGYMRVRFGGYAIHARRVTTTVPGALSMQASGNRVSLSSYEHLSPTPVLEYRLEVGSSPLATDLGVVSLGPRTGTPFTVPFDGVPNGTYFVRLRARTAAGWGPASAEQSVTTTDGPEQLAAFVTGNTVTLRWATPASGSPFFDALNPANPFSWFELLVGSSPGSASLGIYAVEAPRAESTLYYAGVRFFKDYTGIPAGTYYIRVRGRTPAGVTTPSNEVVVTVP
jgi:hypothetical protein